MLLDIHLLFGGHRIRLQVWEPVRNCKDSFLCYFFPLSLLCKVWTFLLNFEVTVSLQCVYVEICFDMACVEDLCSSYLTLGFIKCLVTLPAFCWGGEEMEWVLPLQNLVFFSREICPALRRVVWEPRVLLTALQSSWSDFFQEKEISLETLRKKYVA